MTHEQFTQIYLPFSGRMYALAYNLLRNRDEARDCVQDVYSELWSKRDTIEADKPPLPFVLTMVRNNYLDRLHRCPKFAINYNNKKQSHGQYQHSKYYKKQ